MRNFRLAAIENTVGAVHELAEVSTRDYHGVITSIQLE